MQVSVWRGRVHVCTCVCVQCVHIYIYSCIYVCILCVYCACAYVHIYLSTYLFIHRYTCVSPKVPAVLTIAICAACFLFSNKKRKCAEYKQGAHILAVTVLSWLIKFVVKENDIGNEKI